MMMVQDEHLRFLRFSWSTVRFIVSEPPTWKVMELLGNLKASPCIGARASVLSALLSIDERGDLYPIICRLMGWHLSRIKTPQYEEEAASQPYQVVEKVPFSYYQVMCADEKVIRITEPKRIPFIRRNVMPSPRELEMASHVMRSINSRTWSDVERTILLADDLPYRPPATKSRAEQIEFWKARKQSETRAKANRQRECDMIEKNKRTRLGIQKREITRKYRARMRILRFEQDL